MHSLGNPSDTLLLSGKFHFQTSCRIVLLVKIGGGGPWKAEKVSPRVMLELPLVYPMVLQHRLDLT